MLDLDDDRTGLHALVCHRVAVVQSIGPPRCCNVSTRSIYLYSKMYSISAARDTSYIVLLMVFWQLILCGLKAEY